MPHTLQLAHSADADDVFMWWPITGKVDPRDPTKVLAPPVLDTSPFRFVSVPEDIQVLNKRAMTAGDLDITAVSFATYARITDRYVASACGSSFGDDWGPKLVARAVDGPTLGDLSPRYPRSIAMPGTNTSAYTTLCVLLDGACFVPTEIRFDLITAAVAEGRSDLGLLIHESQLTFAAEGLVELADLGKLWKARTGLPLPLGANVIRRDVENRFGEGSLKRIVGLLDASIRHALSHRQESLDYAHTFSPLESKDDLNTYIDLYVSRYTIDAGAEGARAIDLLWSMGAAKGLLPAHSACELVGP